MDDGDDVTTEEALKHDTYEEYLDSQINDQDLFYLECEELARDLVELGYRGRCASISLSPHPLLSVRCCGAAASGTRGGLGGSCAPDCSIYLTLRSVGPRA